MGMKRIKDVMEKPERVKVFLKGEGSGKVFLLPVTFEQLRSAIKTAFDLVDVVIETQDGAEIDDILLIRDDDALWVHEAGHVNGVSEKQKATAKAGEWITLNVGGRIFTTTRSTLLGRESQSMLALMFGRTEDGGASWHNTCDENGAILVDRSPEFFAPLLNYLRTGKLVLEKNLNPAGVLEEARFFGFSNMLLETLELMSAKFNAETKDDCPPITRREFTMKLLPTISHSTLRCQGMNLEGLDLSNLDLTGINFRYCNLRSVNFTGSNVTGANFERAVLVKAIFDEARMSCVKMKCVNMEFASLKKCNFEDPSGTRANLEGANMKNCTMENSNMQGVNLRVATLRNSNLRNCVLRGACLAGADLENCDLSLCDLQEANLRGANLKDAIFESLLTPLHMSQTLNTLRL